RPPTLLRFESWLKTGVHVAGRPNWVFVKLHTHGCKDSNIDMLLGAPMQDFHSALAGWGRSNPRCRYHYVTAWEMARLVHEAERNGTVDNVLGSQASIRTAPEPATLPS
ncbi:MAG: hypothetical protein KDA75_12280, partial [Planctomycetaceae bacterium]|nr:hypothetical protein [Planctomycetaceae bacterium]